LTPDETMANLDSRVTIHMAASPDDFIARKDGRVDGLGEPMRPRFVLAGLPTKFAIRSCPMLIGDGIPFLDKLDRDIALHLTEVKAYKSGTVELRYDARGHRGESRNAT
jgi:hypothetical protein